MALIAPSILSADFLNLDKEIKMLNESEADWIHCDVMDGRFVPNITFGIPVIKAVKKASKKPLDVHLMIVEPQQYIDDFKKAGADLISVHLEAVNHLHRIIFYIKEKGMMAGVAINPHSPVYSLSEIIKDADFVNVMSVNPGFGGQKFISNTLNKIYELKNLILSKNSNAKIEVDGGVDSDNAPDLLKAGADILVAGNSVFSAPDPLQMISRLKTVNQNTATV
ncbi:MAG: ribulose-phosphate 3-epimerase [Chitinophagales bacterium]